MNLMNLNNKQAHFIDTYIDQMTFRKSEYKTEVDLFASCVTSSMISLEDIIDLNEKFVHLDGDHLSDFFNGDEGKDNLIFYLLLCSEYLVNFIRVNYKGKGLL